MDDDDRLDRIQVELKSFGLLAGFLLFVIVTSIIFFHTVEHFSWLNAYYYTVVTIATVGYGDIVPKTPAGKIGATVLIFIGIGTFATFANLLLRRRYMKRTERRLRK